MTFSILPKIFDFTIGTQLLGTYNINDSASGVYGIGSPIFYLTEASPLLSTSISKTFNDDTIELNMFTMVEILAGYGASAGFEIHYDILDNLNSSINFSKFLKGNDQSVFNHLIDYSSMQLIFKYSF